MVFTWISWVFIFPRARIEITIQVTMYIKKSKNKVGEKSECKHSLIGYYYVHFAMQKWEKFG